MCGIAGFWSRGSADDAASARRMANAIAHRGPDADGVWVDRDAGIALAHRRLSIVDLSPAGSQPMVSPCGRWVIVFNGEIYNHASLRAELDRVAGGFDWRGHSDTETLLAALRHWGVDGALRRCNGMFAFALWDRATRSLTLARDRMGEKPLYYGHAGASLLFGSELKALAAHPDWRGDVDRDALTTFLRFNNVPAPLCIYQGIRKLAPAHYVVVAEGGQQLGEPVCYWSLAAVAEAGLDEPERGTAAEVVERFDALLADAVSMRMVADVPVGAFLSGGLDSTAVVAMMQAASPRPVRTFAIGFRESGFDEAPYARAVSAHLGTDHTELYVQSRDALAVVPRLPEIWDEPFSDSSQIPVYLVSELARRDVTVSLSGDGGDELLCGYGRYLTGARLWQRLSLAPRPLRAAVARTLRGNAARAVARAAGTDAEATLAKVAEVLAYPNVGALYERIVSHWKTPAALVPGGSEPANLFRQPALWPRLAGPRESMMYLDALTYLPDDILTKVDRASMAVSLETRIPFLDHRVVEYAWRLPTQWKFREGQTKWLLRQVLDRYVPRRLFDRPKQGFSVPIEAWLRGPLEDWADALLDQRKLRDEGFFDPRPIHAMWSERKQTGWRWAHYLWVILMFESWLGARPTTLGNTI